MTQKPTAHHRASHLLIHEPPLQVLPSLAVAVGLNEAIVLQQIHYWLQRSQNEINGHLWVYNSVAEWKKQFPFWATNTIVRTLTSLRTSGVVVAEHLSDNPRDRSLYYRIDYDVLADLTAEERHTDITEMGKCTYPEWVNGHTHSGLMDAPKMGKSLYKTETTSETTQRDTPKPPAQQAPGASGSKATAISLATWLSNMKASGELPIPEDDPVFEYAEQAGIPLDMLRLCWIEFRQRYSEPGAKRYKDWRSVYRKAVRGNWLKLWFCNADGYTLTTAGLQAQRALQAKEGLAA